MHQGKFFLEVSKEKFWCAGGILPLQTCVGYCANDVKATFEVFGKVLPEFLYHAPHPVTFAGMLEMGTAYLPIDNSWERYIKDTNETYEDLENEMKNTLMKLAEDSCRLIHNKRLV